jgi:hypothetical protein
MRLVCTKVCEEMEIRCCRLLRSKISEVFHSQCSVEVSYANCFLLLRRECTPPLQFLSRADFPCFKGTYHSLKLTAVLERFTHNHDLCTNVVLLLF